MRAVLLLALVATACAPEVEAPIVSDPGLGGSPPLATRAPTPIPEFPFDAVTLEVNGEFVRPHSILLEDRPYEITLGFPMRLDRRATERILREQLPPQTTVDWLDDARVRLTIPVGARFAVNVAGAPAADGRSRLAYAGPLVWLAPRKEIQLYPVEDLVRGVARPVASWTLRAGGGISISPDRRHALLYASRSPELGPNPPRLVELATGAFRELPLPTDEYLYAFADWLPDGRLLFVGKSAWLGDGEGRSFTRVWAGWPQGELPWVVAPSPSGRYVAIWDYEANGPLTMLELANGRTWTIPGPFRRCGDDAGISIEWAPHDTQLAGTDCAFDDFRPQRRVVDASSGREVALLAGHLPLPWRTGGLQILHRWPDDPKSGDAGTTFVYGPDGRLLQTIKEFGVYGLAGTMHFLRVEYGEGTAAWSVVDARTGAAKAISLPEHPYTFTRRGELAVVIHRDP